MSRQKKSYLTPSFPTRLSSSLPQIQEMDLLVTVRQPREPGDANTEPCESNCDVLGSTAGGTKYERTHEVWSAQDGVMYPGADTTNGEPQIYLSACIMIDSQGPGAGENPLKRAVFDPSATVRHSEYLEYLEVERVHILLGGGDGERHRVVLKKLADEIQPLKPTNEACLHNDMQVLDELIGEMRIVAELLPDYANKRGAFVLSNWRYAESLKNMVKRSGAE